MNKFILGAAAVAFSISPAHAVEDYVENNIQFKTGNSSITFRKYTAGVDYNMVQLDTKLAGWGYTYRWTDSGGTVENRYRLTAPKIDLVGNFYLKPRTEIKTYESGAKDDFVNLQPIIAADYEITDKLSAYIDLKPKFAVGSDKYSDGEFYESQNDFGIDYALSDALSVGVFYEYNTDGDGNKTDDFLGTSVVVKF